MTPEPHHVVELGPACLAGVETITVSSRRSFPRHAHDQFGLGIMRAGGHLSWSERGQVEAGSGDVIAVSPNEMHDGMPVRGYRVWQMVFVEPQTIARMVGSHAAVRELGFAACAAPSLKVELEHALAALHDADAPAAEEALTLLFSEALLTASPIEKRSPSQGTKRALERIRDQPMLSPSLDEVARLMGMHRTNALRRFRSEIGATPHAYAMQIRLRLARRAITAGTSLADVASDLGFADQSHLTRAFVRQLGVPPGRYRSANIVQD